MRYQELYSNFRQTPVFSLNDIRNIDHNFYRPRLNEWQEKGYIRKIIRGYYSFPENMQSESSLFEIANRIYSPSYVSCETALAYYGLIPEGVYQMTSVTTLKSYLFRTAAGSFRYRSIDPRLFFGYEPVRKNGDIFKIALPEKAVLDLLHYNAGLKDVEALAGMRLNTVKLKELITGAKFNTFVKRAVDGMLVKRVAALKEYIKHA